MRKQEFVIAGWQEGEGARHGVPGSLLVGYYDVLPEEARRRNQRQKLIYAGKVDCIFIDPPYNTGNEGWVYNDRVNSPMIRDWLGRNDGDEQITSRRGHY